MTFAPARLDASVFLDQPGCAAVMAALDPGRAGIARFVGGPVRNALMGTPVDDVDIATTLRPEEIIAAAEAAGLKAIPTGIDHGTVTIVADHCLFEVTTLRVDLKTDGRHAVVGFTQDWAEDAKRRDFTMNALYADLDGTVHDPLAGYDDLVARRVRFVGDPATRIREDVLRILRYYRFFGTYGADTPDLEAISACRTHAGLVPLLSAERVRGEMLKLLLAGGAEKALRQMAADGVLQKVLPGGFDIARVARLTRDVPEADPIQRLTALAQPPAEALAKGMRLSNEEQVRLKAGWAEWPLPASDRAIARAFYEKGPAVVLDRIVFGVAEGKAAAGDLRAASKKASGWTRPVLPVNGADAKAAGVIPGPQMGDVLRAVESWWADRDFAPDRAACLAEMNRLLQS